MPMFNLFFWRARDRFLLLKMEGKWEEKKLAGFFPFVRGLQCCQRKLDLDSAFGGNSEILQAAILRVSQGLFCVSG